MAKVRCAPALGLFVLATTSCSSGPGQPVTISDLDSDPAHALVSTATGDTLLFRDSGIDRLTAAGALVHVRDDSYRTCPTSYPFLPASSMEKWPNIADDEANLLAGQSQTQVYLWTPDCGLWRQPFDGDPRQVVPFVFDDRGPSGAWLAQGGPRIDGARPVPAVDDGAATIACLSVEADTEADVPEHIEVWRIGADGVPLEKLYAAATSTNDLTSNSDTRCERILADGQAITWYERTGEHGLLRRFDRATHEVSILAQGDAWGFLLSLAETADAIYVVPTDLHSLVEPIVRVKRTGGPPETVVPGMLEDARTPVRYALQVHGPNIYWIEDFALRRADLDGQNVETLVQGGGSGGITIGYVVRDGEVDFEQVQLGAPKPTYALMRLPL